MLFVCSPDGIRTRATALRGRRARPLHNGALAVLVDRVVRGTEKNLTGWKDILRIDAGCAQSTPSSMAGVPGLEPRTDEPESPVLPITPYPMGYAVRPLSEESGPAANRGSTLPVRSPAPQIAPHRERVLTSQAGPRPCLVASGPKGWRAQVTRRALASSTSSVVTGSFWRSATPPRSCHAPPLTRNRPVSTVSAFTAAAGSGCTYVCRMLPDG